MKNISTKASNKHKLILICVLFCGPVIAQNNNSSVQQAISFLKSACVTSGSSLDITATSGGTFQLKSTQSTGAQGSIILNKKELEGFADAASMVSAQQASEMRNCMKPYIDKILASLLTNGAVVGPKSFNVTTEGYYFVTEEFDKVMAVFAESDGRPTPLNFVTSKTNLSIAKVRHYAEIARSNNLGNLNEYSQITFLINRQGVAYVLSKEALK